MFKFILLAGLKNSSPSWLSNFLLGVPIPVLPSEFQSDSLASAWFLDIWTVSNLKFPSAPLTSPLPPVLSWVPGVSVFPTFLMSANWVLILFNSGYLSLSSDPLPPCRIFHLGGIFLPPLPAFFGGGGGWWFSWVGLPSFILSSSSFHSFSSSSTFFLVSNSLTFVLYWSASMVSLGFGLGKFILVS